MDLDLDCLSSLMVLMEERHYGRAAARLHVTSSALTKRIQRLERQIGASLVERGPIGMLSLTPAGLRLAAEAGPLLAHAGAVRDAARGDDCRQPVRLGVPGRVGDYPERHELTLIGQWLRRGFPDARLVCLGVPFPELSSCLAQRRVDVLWTASEVEDRDVVSIPLAQVQRKGLVGARHELEDAGELDVGTFSELPMIFNPAVPATWMRQWYLGDVRPAREARLVEVLAQDSASVLRQVARGTGVTVLHAPLTRMLGPEFRIVELSGVPPVTFHAARRDLDRREPVLALIGFLAQLAAHSVAAS